MADRRENDKQGSANDNRDSANVTPGGLPLLNSGWSAGQWDFKPGSAFWDHIGGLEADCPLSQQMDLAMAGKSAPRVWLIMHEPGHPELSAVVALAFARELANRDQAALVLDCDDQSQSLTRWAERLESDGWIDLARYGTSVLTSGVPLPFDGRRGYLLGVGSFAPTDITNEEIQQVVQRLRRQADDIILLAPADAIGQQWADVTNIRLLCWDRATRRADDLEGLVASLNEAGHGLTGLVGFGLPMAEPVVEPIVEEVAEVEEPDEPAEPVTEETPEEIAPEEPAVGEEIEPVVSVAQPAEVGADVEEEVDQSGWVDAPVVDENDPARKGTSGIIWFLATAAVVVVAILGAYWFKYGKVPENELTGPAVVATQQSTVERPPANPVHGDMANQDDPVDETLEMAAADTLTGAQSELDGEEPADAAANPQVSAAGPFDDQKTEPEAEIPTEVVAETPATAPAFSMDPYRLTVGSAGWALHLYSFPDSSSAGNELTELRRRGFETEIRVVEIPQKGRWWRIYVGSFASKREAWDASPMLLNKLRTDWAKPTEF